MCLRTSVLQELTVGDQVICYYVVIFSLLVFVLQQFSVQGCLFTLSLSFLMQKRMQRGWMAASMRVEAWCWLRAY